MNHTNQTDAFWQGYLATLPVDAKQHGLPYTVWDFADTPEDATEVGQLVRLGIKTTTSSLMWGLEQSGEPLPEVGELGVVVDGEGKPLCIIEVTGVEIKPFNAVDEQFAFEYGEGERTLVGRRSDNWDYLARWCAQIGRVPSETILGTVRPDGRPHAAGVGALWHAGHFYIVSGPATRKSRNLAANPACTLAVRLEGIDLIFEGKAFRVTEPPTLEEVARLYCASGWPAAVENDAFTAPYSAPSAGPPPWYVYQFTYHTVYGVATAAPHGATRWRFAC